MYIENHENYLQKKNVPIDPFIKLGVSDKFFANTGGQNGDSLGEADGEGEGEEPQINALEKISEMFSFPEYAEVRARVSAIV